MEGSINEVLGKAEGGVTTYTVSFNSNGGSAVSSQRVKAGECAIYPDVPAKAGMNFGYWYSDSGLTEAYNFDDPVNSNFTLYASWVSPETHKHTVTFDYGDGETAVTVDIYEGERVSKPETPTRTNHVFDNWYTSSGFTHLFNFSIPITGPVTIYAKWNILYTVQFNADRPAGLDTAVGSTGGTTETQSFVGGTAQDLRNNTFTCRGHDFAGWATTSGGTVKYADGQNVDYDSFSPEAAAGAVIKLYAKWNEVANVYSVSSLGTDPTLDAQFSWLRTNALSNKTYNIQASGNEGLTAGTTGNGRSLSYTGYTNVTINLTGSGGVRTITLTGNGSLFTIESGVTLALGTNITLEGYGSNNASVVRVNGAGTLEMKTGSKIINNESNTNGGGVYVNTSGTLTMNGGEISGNICTGATNRGGGVYVNEGATFTMSGGDISDNEANGSSGNGGGVYVFNGTFALSGTAKIIGNKATNNGGGVYVSSNSGTFTMSDTATISNNKATSGGGVYLTGSGTSVTMSGGEIFGNTATSYGGGVGLGSGTFRIVTGTVYGTNEPNTDLRNNAPNGAALYFYVSYTGERGTFSGATWNPTGTLSTTDNTVRVMNGDLY